MTPGGDAFDKREDGWQPALLAVFVFAECPYFLLECAFSQPPP